MTDHLTPLQAADRLSLSESTVRRMCDDGTLDYWTTPGGHRRITPDSVDAYAKRTVDGVA